VFEECLGNRKDVRVAMRPKSKRKSVGRITSLDANVPAKEPSVVWSRYLPHAYVFVFRVDEMYRKGYKSSEH
jgi:hypothetical protein